jgi:hypothetical protein
MLRAKSLFLFVETKTDCARRYQHSVCPARSGRSHGLDADHYQLRTHRTLSSRPQGEVFNEVCPTKNIGLDDRCSSCPRPPAIPLLRNLIDQQGAVWLSLKLEPEWPAAP